MFIQLADTLGASHKGKGGDEPADESAFNYRAIVGGVTAKLQGAANAYLLIKGKPPMWISRSATYQIMQESNIVFLRIKHTETELKIAQHYAASFRKTLKQLHAIFSNSIARVGIASIMYTFFFYLCLTSL